MQSSTFQGTVYIASGATYTYFDAWDEPTTYRNFYGMIKSDRKCLVTIYQDSRASPSQSSPNAVKKFSYIVRDQTQVFSGILSNRFISFSIKNLDDSSSTTQFYVVYK